MGHVAGAYQVNLATAIAATTIPTAQSTTISLARVALTTAGG